LANFGQFEQNQLVFLFFWSMWLKLMKTIAFPQFWQLCQKFNENRVFFLVLVNVAAIGENSLF